MSNLAIWDKHADIDPTFTKPITVDSHFRARFDKLVSRNEDGCWIWTGSTSLNGYGQFHVCRMDGKQIVRHAHRVSFAINRGPIPAGMDLDHLCRVRNCVNPDHLEAVTRSENLRRGAGGDIARATKASLTHCPSGHPYSGENLYMTPDGKRACRECRKAAGRRYSEAKRG